MYIYVCAKFSKLSKKFWNGVRYTLVALCLRLIHVNGAVVLCSPFVL